MTRPMPAARTPRADRPRRYAYADPPYLGLAAKFYSDLHPAAAEYDDPATHWRLVERLPPISLMRNSTAGEPYFSDYMYCRCCGSPLVTILGEHPDGYDRVTGEALVRITWRRGCPATDQTRSIHDGWVGSEHVRVKGT